MLFLTATTDKLQLITSAAGDVDVHASAIDALTAGLTSPASLRQNTTITTAATTDILAAPAASTTRTVKMMSIRNTHATIANDVTVIFNQNGTLYEIWKQTLRAGEALVFTEMLGFYVVPSSRIDRWIKVKGSDYVNATTSFTDIMTVPVPNGKTLNFETHLYHAANASTTGPRFGINGPTLTGIQVFQVIRSVTLTSVDATVVESQSAGPATAVDTSPGGATATGNTSVTAAILSGVFTTGADGTFAIRGQSEVAVAAGLTVKVGSWLHVWEETG